jgi:hypothetical protein
MTDLSRLKAASEVIQDEQGNKFVRVPLQVWQEEIDMPNTTITPEEQHRALKALLADWSAHPDDTPAEWWAEFDAFLKDNRMQFPERDLGFKDE